MQVAHHQCSAPQHRHRITAHMFKKPSRQSTKNGSPDDLQRIMNRTTSNCTGALICESCWHISYREVSCRTPQAMRRITTDITTSSPAHLPRLMLPYPSADSTLCPAILHWAARGP